ncbi:putative nuclease HARBI1 [Lineus longissimus]|uniref:putative nuclease HARBI1 n=1 Tax=Lineus longissimus TaxID=88925 RepID=UPI00315DF56A
MAAYVNRIENIRRLVDIENGHPRRVRHLHYVDLDENRTDEDFRKRYRFTRDGFTRILYFLRDDLPEPVNNRGNPVPPSLQLRIALRFYATGSFQIVAEDLLQISQSSVSKIVANVSRVIARKRGDFIQFPEGQAATAMQAKYYEIAEFPLVVGCVDGTHIPIQAPNLENREIYRCRKSFMSLNVQGISDANLKFINIVVRWPGSTHDARIFDNSLICTRFENNELTGLLLGDPGYPCRPFLMTPFRNPNGPAENSFNRAQRRTRSLVERMFGVWKRRFPCLKFGIRCKLTTTMAVIVATAVLHNIATDLREDDFPDENNEAEMEGIGDVDNAALHDVLGNAMRQTIVQRYFQ